VLVALALGAAGSLALRMARFQQPPLLYLRDFVQDWLWARALRDGLAPYAPTTLLAETYLGDCCVVHLPHASPHPPLAGLLVLPLTWLDLQTASLAWAGLELVCLALVVGMLSRQSWTTVLVLTGALLAWHPLRTEMVHGQFTVLQLLLLVLAYRDRQTGRELRAGILLGLAICLKPIVLPLVLVLLRERQVRGLIGLCLAVISVGSLSLALLGPHGLETYLRELPQTGGLYQDYVLNMSIWTVGWKLSPDHPEIAASLSMGAGLLLLGGIGVFLWRARNRDLAFGAVLAASTVLNPVAWDIYLVLALLPLAQVAQTLQARHRPRRDLAFLLILALGSLVAPAPQLPTLVNLIPLAVLLAFTVYVARLAMEKPGEVQFVPIGEQSRGNAMGDLKLSPLPLGEG
jgi:hypothetical protein